MWYQPCYLSELSLVELVSLSIFISARNEQRQSLLAAHLGLIHEIKLFPRPLYIYLSSKLFQNQRHA